MYDLGHFLFFDAEVSGQFWNNVEDIMYVAMPLLLIFVGTKVAGKVIRMIRDLFNKSLAAAKKQLGGGSYKYKYEKSSKWEKE